MEYLQRTQKCKHKDIAKDNVTDKDKEKDVDKDKDTNKDKEEDKEGDGGQPNPCKCTIRVVTL